jgi:hypothetical protein
MSSAQNNYGYAISPIAITGLTALGAAIFVVCCAAVARISGFRWPDNERNPYHISDEQGIYMREVRDRNWAGAMVAAGARGPPPQRQSHWDTTRR